ncbi:hypothetical protein [Tardibacter chloracetimidivorans]|nr:hypothetical protein [Tardibacter chloracetimidivorans]
MTYGLFIGVGTGTGKATGLMITRSCGRVRQRPWLRYHYRQYVGVNDARP